MAGRRRWGRFVGAWRRGLWRSALLSADWLLEEFCKPWDHILSDEFMNLIYPSEVAFDSLGGIAEDYAIGRLRIECHFSFALQGETHRVVIIESDVRGDALMQFEINHSPMNGSSSVLINVTKLVETPKKVAPNIHFIRSVVRLKRFNDCDCFCGYTHRSTPNQRIIPFLKNGELSILGIGTGGISGQGPHQLVKRCTQAEEDIASYEGQSRRRVCNLDANAIPLIFGIDLIHKFARIRLNKQGDFVTEVIKVFLRPGCFEIGISELHD